VKHRPVADSERLQLVTGKIVDERLIGLLQWDRVDPTRQVKT
jgi:hypothetical protein